MGKTTSRRAGVDRRAQAHEQKMARNRSDLAKLRAEQAELSAKLGGDAPSVDALKADEAFRENWKAQQRLIYPDLYRLADERLAGDSEPTAVPGVPLGLFDERPLGLEPGHDPTLQERYRRAVEQGEIASDEEGVPATTGDTAPSVNNQPPGENRVTTVPSQRVSDESVTPASLANAEAETRTQRATQKAADKK